MKQPNNARIVTIAVLSVLILAVVIMIVRLIFWANQPSGTTINIPTVRVSKPEPQPISLDTPYFSTLIPAGYSTQDNSDPNNPSSVQILAYKTGVEGTDIGFTSNSLPSDGIYGVADYKMRRSEGSGYTLIPPDGFGGAEYVFRKTKEKPEMTAFVVHNDRYLTIAVTGGTESLQAEQLQQAVANLTWK